MKVNFSPSSLHTVGFQENELIFAEGTPGDCAYIIESGQVQIFMASPSHPIPLKVLGPGDIFGEMSVIDASPRSASAMAIDDCVCIVVSRSQIAERINDSDPVVKLLIDILLRRTREQNTLLKINSQRDVTSFSDKPAIQSSLGEDQRLVILEKMKLEAELKEALNRHELEPYYQPLVDLQTHEIVGFESLIRWNSPMRGLVQPGLFIDLAEETSLIMPIGLYILEASCRDLSAIQSACNQEHCPQARLFVSVNVSVKQIQEPSFIDQLLTIVQHYGLQPEQIKLEVTERIFLESGAAIQTIQKCRQAGFTISLDDFGTGFSSLNYISRCEIDSLKIDQSFVRQMFSNDKTLVLMNSIIELTHRLNMPSFAEGIETLQQMEALRNLGCHIGQGYLFGKPMVLADAIALLGSRPLKFSL